MSDPGSRAVIELEGVSKRYVKYEDTPTLLGRAIARRNKTTRSSLWAVRGVDLAVEPGETLGVLGRNGSGKSTMLRMLAGVTAPTEGIVRVRGRIAPLIEVGVGFHPELTGRENVYVNGTILGLASREIDDLFDSIVDFAELPDFIDTPVKFYSSGMFVRLGFAVAVAAQPDILLIDEVLAVGDLRFQMKCFNRMTELKAGGATVVLVTHNLQATRNMCDRTLVLHDGEPHFLGATNEAISVYHELLAAAPRGSATVAAAAGPVEAITTGLVGADDQPAAFAKTGDTVTFQTQVRFREAVAEPIYGLVITSGAGVHVYSESTYLDDRQPVRADDVVMCEARMDLSLVTGSYEARGVVAWGEGPEENMASRPVSFFVSGRDLVEGITDLGAQFRVERATPTAPADEATRS